MYSPEDLILAQQLNEYAAGRGMRPMASTGSVSELLAGGSPVQGPVASTIRDPGNYKTRASGNRVGDMMIDTASTYGDLSGQFYDGMSKPVRQAKAGIGRAVGQKTRRMAGSAGKAIAGLPAMGKVGAALRFLGPAAGAAGGALAVGDLLMGQESLGNKAMDATAMTIGGLLGSVGGPLGTAAGAGLGKMASDATQFIFGGGKSAEERKMEEALAMLRGGRG